MKTILVISHDAHRAGAPILLLRFLKQLYYTGNYKIITVFRHGGELQADFEALGPTFLWYKSHKPLNSDTLSNFFHKIGYLDTYIKNKQLAWEKNIIKSLQTEKPGLLLANTIASADVYQKLQHLALSKVSYIHELDSAFKVFSDESSIANMLNTSNYIWTPCQAVKNYLEKNYFTSPEKTLVLHTIIEGDVVKNKPKNHNSEEFIVGTVGTLDHRKGYDLFLEIAQKVINSNNKRNIRFIWVGADKTTDTYKKATEFISKNKLEFNILIIEKQKNVQKFYEGFNLLLITSREDPYPLVTLEAAQNNLPILCFDEQAGGAADFVAEDCGKIIPYLNTELAAKTVIELANNVTLCSEMANNAFEKVNKLHSPDIGTKQLIEYIEKATTSTYGVNQ
jgi:glycosyltransferase involved in cell wall biosynthesis